MPDLLLELFSEDIPARLQKQAGIDLQNAMTTALSDNQIPFAHAEHETTPKRLMLHIAGLPWQSAVQIQTIKGPAVDAPQAAINGFLRRTNMNQNQLVIREHKNKQTYFAVSEQKGRPISDIIANAVQTTLRRFPWPKSMRWGTGQMQWIRPLRSIMCFLYDDTKTNIVDIKIDGLVAGQTTYGHRFLAPNGVRVCSLQNYKSTLESAYVVLSRAERRQRIQQHITALIANTAKECECIDDPALLDEVCGLAEWPVCLLGDIDQDFATLPTEVLQVSMKEHQRFFAVFNRKKHTIDHFIAVMDHAPRDGGAVVLQGLQKVLTARLRDAKFFWENDRRIAQRDFADWRDILSRAIFQADLGTQSQRIKRIVALSGFVAPLVAAKRNNVQQAAALCKLDLASGMVAEFPRLQGVMGGYYAKHANYSDAIAKAVRGHYAPTGRFDNVPTDATTIAVALADKIDTVVGFWLIDEKPSGSKDPFALRRAVLGVMRIIIENKHRLCLLRVFVQAVNVFAEYHPVLVQQQHQKQACENSTFADFADTVAHSLLAFVHDRLVVYLRDEGIRHDIIEACLSVQGNSDLVLLTKRIAALSEFLNSPDGANLLFGFKRIHSILLQAIDKNDIDWHALRATPLRDDLMHTPQEQALFNAFKNHFDDIKSTLETHNFVQTMHIFASFKNPIDDFFDTIQINTDNTPLRHNRLRLLYHMHALCLDIADFPRIKSPAL